jgi:hypothetical protein
VVLGSARMLAPVSESIMAHIEVGAGVRVMVGVREGTRVLVRVRVGVLTPAVVEE